MVGRDSRSLQLLNAISELLRKLRDKFVPSIFEHRDKIIPVFLFWNLLRSVDRQTREHIRRNVDVERRENLSFIKYANVGGWTDSGWCEKRTRFRDVRDSRYFSQELTGVAVRVGSWGSHG